MKVDEAKRRLYRFILLFVVLLAGALSIEFILTGDIYYTGVFLFISPAITGLYILNLMAENLFVSTRKND